MPIKGSLREASLPDVLQLLALSQKTGCLAVTDRSNFGYVYLEQGNICYAAIVNRRDRLGDLLVKNGLVEPGTLAAAVEAQGSRTAQRLGEILVERGAISREQLEHFIRLQIEEAVYYLFTWTQGSFYFEVDQRPEEGALLVSINPESLLLEGARRVDEWSLIEKKVPSLDLVFGLDPEHAAQADTDLTPEQRRVLPLLDGRRSVREVMEESGLVEFEVGKALYGLIQAGFAHPLGRKPSRAVAEPTGRVQEHRNLGVAFYRTGLYEEAEREFRRVLELEPDDLDARFQLGLIALRAGRDRAAIRWFKEVVERGGRWASAFHNLALALERLGRPDDALLALREALELRPDHPRLLLSEMVLLCKAGRPREALDAAERYRRQVAEGDRPPASFFTFAVLAEAACGRSDEALALGDEGLALLPHAAPLWLAMGAVHERLGAWDQAEVHYRRAVEEGAELPQAHKSLGDALYRRAAYAEAAEAYQRAVALAPRLGDDAYFKLGNIRYKQGDREDAVRLWTAALELNPDHGVARTNLELVRKVLAGRES